MSDEMVTCLTPGGSTPHSQDKSCFNPVPVKPHDPVKDAIDLLTEKGYTVTRPKKVKYIYYKDVLPGDELHGEIVVSVEPPRNVIVRYQNGKHEEYSARAVAFVKRYVD